MKKLKITIRGSQSDLLSIARSATRSCRRYLARFAERSTLYNLAYLADLDAKIATASKNDTAPLRRQDQSDSRVLLTIIANTTLTNAQMLKGYVELAATELQLSTWLQAAGMGYYEKAAGYQWSSLQDLLNTGSLFIAANLQALTGMGFMPANFPAAFDADKKSFQDALDNFYADESLKVEASEKRAVLFNEIYAEVIAMFKYAQKLFAGEEAIRRQFVYDLLLSKMKSGGIAAIKGRIINIDTQQPVEGVSVTSADGNYSAVSDVNGEYEITQVAADIYTLTFEKEGFETVTQIVDVKTGVAHRGDIALKATEFLLKLPD